MNNYEGNTKKQMYPFYVESMISKEVKLKNKLINAFVVRKK